MAVSLLKGDLYDSTHSVINTCASGDYKLTRQISSWGIYRYLITFCLYLSSCFVLFCFFLLRSGHGGSHHC